MLPNTIPTSHTYVLASKPFIKLPTNRFVHFSQYPPQPYKFGYDVKDGYGGNLNQKEEGDSYGNKKGKSYS